MILSLSILITVFVTDFRFLDFASRGVPLIFNATMSLKAGLLMLSFVFFGAVFMTIFASFTKTYKEAQTYLGFIMVISTMPLLYVMMYSFKTVSWMMPIPCLSQTLLILSVFKEKTLNLFHLTLSTTSTLTIGLLLSWLIIRRYQHENILNWSIAGWSKRSTC